MLFAVAHQETPPVVYARIFERQTSRRRVGAYDGCIEIDQMTVVDSCPLGGAYAVCIVTGRTRYLLA